MIALLVNLATTVAGSAIGLALKKGISARVSDAVFAAIGLCVIFIGITGLFTGANAIIMLLAFAVGTFVGAGLDLDGKLDRAGKALERKFVKADPGAVGSSSRDLGIASGAITFFLISCTGAYTITACFNAGFGDYNMLYTKAVIDLIAAVIMTASLGIGVMFSIIPMFIYQGLLILFSSVLSPLLNESMIAAMSCAGALITIVIGTNIMGITKLKAVDYIPAVIFAPLFQYISEFVMG